ncbi:PTS sugar transporter subunit IIA [bacterium]|nr:PTS sugar transporter subunit IIA [bacterium]
MYEEDEILTIREVAKYLKMNERSIYKLAHQGLIPTVKIASQWRFRKNLIDAWLESQMATAAMNYLSDASAENVSVHSLLKPEGINTNLAGKRKEEVLRELADLMVKVHCIRDGNRFLREILNRERLCTTAIQKGVAMPHPRRNGNQFVKSPALVYGCSKKGVDFGSLDGEPTHLFFMLCARQDSLHLKIMATINNLLSSAELRDELIAATSADDVINIIRREEGVREES